MSGILSNIDIEKSLNIVNDNLGGSVRVTSVRARGVCWENDDRSLPVSLDVRDGWKAVGDIGVDFKT